jgi:hypothetical protein
MKPPLDVIDVKATGDHMLHLKFENGEERVFDMAPYMGEKSFIRVKNTPPVHVSKSEA